MSSAISTRGLRLDNRGVTPIIGFILLFGIGVIAFASYQATTVPDQNAETEFTHSQDIRDEMVDIRSGLLQAHNGDRQFRSITLGTRYQQRLLAINPPPTTGSLETSNPAVIDLEGEGQIETRFLSYQPRYSEIPNDGVVYDTSALYLDPELSDGTVLFEEQGMIDDDEVRLTALQNSYQREGVERASVDLRPGASAPLNISSEIDGEFTITVPTRLSEDDWNDMLNENWNFESNGDGLNELILEFDESRSLYLNTIGIGTPPVGAPEGIFSAVLESADVSDLDRADGIQDQMFNFSVGEDGLEENETIEIQIEDPIDDVDYSDAMAQTTDGDVEFIYTEEQAKITYMAPEDLQSGSQVSISLEGVDATDAPFGEAYSVNFVDILGGAEQDTFTILDSDRPPEGTLSNLDIADQGDSATVLTTENEDVSIDLKNEGGIGEIDVDLVINQETFSDSVVLETGEEQTVTFEEVTGDLPPGEYDVEVSTESDSEIGSLSVRTPPGFTFVNADDVPRNDAPSPQTLSFELNETLESGETVSIDLTDPQEEFGDGYQGSSISEDESSLAGGSVEFTIQEADEAEVTFTADEDVGSEETIEIVVDNVEYPNGNLDDYSVIFDRSDGTSETATFTDFN